MMWLWALGAWLGVALAQTEEAPGVSMAYPAEAYRAAELLDMQPGFVADLQAGLELIYLRKYQSALTHFQAMEAEYPGTGVSPVAETLVWQARMLENFDYRFDKEYWASSKRSRQAIETALKDPGNEAWEHLVMATLLGIESIHNMRRMQYLSSLRVAFQAMDHITSSREAAPGFIDLELADGLYNYWRTILTQRSRMLPSFGDHRAKGIAQMQRVEREGLFMQPMATLALAFVWMEEKDMGKAAAACDRNRRRYPDNIINNIMSGLIAIEQRKFDAALSHLDRVHAVDSGNVRANYWKGVAYLRKGELDTSRTFLQAYLASPHLEKYQQAYANYRLGQVASREENWSEAADFYTKAMRIDGHKGAKKSLERLKERRREGTIDW